MICLITTSRCCLLLLAAASLVSHSLAAEKAPAIDFGRDIRPIFSENCYACHGPDKDKRKAPPPACWLRLW